MTQESDWKEAALLDGWTGRHLYNEGDPYYELTHPDGWVAHVNLRDQFDAPCVHLWAPDGLKVYVTYPYSMEALVAGMRHCGNCGATDVDTQRYSFAGRCCEACRPEMAKKFEQPGWTS